MGSLKSDLQLKTAFPGFRPSEVKLVETHISWIFLTESEVYKVKKPVCLGFLDYSTIEKRKEACEAEVALNQRLASGVYLGVVPVTLDPIQGHQFRGQGRIVDWAVHMVRLPDYTRADQLLRNGRLTVNQIDQLAKRFHRFHHQALRNSTTAWYGIPKNIALNLKENFSQASQFIQNYITSVEMHEIQEWQVNYLNRHKSAFEQRMKDNWIRDGHGDLRLEHIYFHGDIQTIDCIEFNSRFRYGDVASDLAFLSMDLKFHSKKDLAERLIAQYVGESNDFSLYQVVDFYENYRAYVRGKVCAFLANDRDVPAEVSKNAHVMAQHYFLLAYSLIRHAPKLPKLIVVGGRLASGKSTVANALAKEFSIPVISSDRTRKSLFQTPSDPSIHTPPWKGIYSDQMTDRVYTELLERAKYVLHSGRSVILDATFRNHGLRENCRRVAAQMNIPFFFIECSAPEEVCRQRLIDREKLSQSSSRSESDGRLEINRSFSLKYEKATELPNEEYLLIDTSQTLEQNVKEIQNKIESIRYYAAS